MFHLFSHLCDAVALIISIVAWASLFEWTLHRFVMHKPILKFTYAFRAHALVHHRLFKSDSTYHLSAHDDPTDKKTIPMAWWNWLVLVPVAVLPFAIVGFLGRAIVAVTAVAVISGYYGLYEYLHWCMHLPKERRLERLGLFCRLNGHHLLHHRYMNKNFNVVLPLADLCLGTLLTRSPVSFAQARGPMIPDVQPRPLRAISGKVLK